MLPVPWICQSLLGRLPDTCWGQSGFSGINSSGLICLALEIIFLLTTLLALVFYALVLNTGMVEDA